MIPAERKQDVIQSGINFIRSLTEAYGSDEGMKFWEVMAQTIDPDIKGQIFFSLVTGEYDGILIITGCRASANKVAMIKAVRSVDTRMLDLKSAKDICDDLWTGKPQRIHVDPKNRHRATQELRDAGFYL